MLAAIGKRYFI